MTVTPPLDTAAQVHALPSLRAVYDIPGHGQDWQDRRRAAVRAITSDACEYARVVPGVFEARFLEWLSGFEPELCAAAANLMRRAFEAGQAAREDDGSG